MRSLSPTESIVIPNLPQATARLLRAIAALMSRHATLAASAGIFSVALAVRLINLHQPLVENFIDRQVHTAMMARNIARGESLLYPQVDIGPFPAYYMLEFPGYPAVVAAVTKLSGMELDAAGRLVSALAMAAACVLFFDLVRRHDGIATGATAAIALALMPVTIRYGRAFQADSMMFALMVAAVWLMDRFAEHGRRRDLALAALATGGALLLKVISAYLLLPIAYLAWCRDGWKFPRRPALWLALAVAALPAAAWYVHAWHVASTNQAISTSFWNADRWFAPERFIDLAIYKQLAYFVGWRVLTPIALVLALVGALLRVNRAERPSTSRRWSFHFWLASFVFYLPILLRKVDHEHYYLAIAPVAAVFIARALVALASAPLGDRFFVSGRTAAVALAAGLIATDVLAAASTFRDPVEWRHVRAAAAAARECTPPDALVVAHSAVLFYADRRGFPMVYGPSEVRYQFATFGDSRESPTPATLLELYREQGATHFVELLGTNRERDNAEFFRSMRSSHTISRDSPGRFVVIELPRE